MLAIGIDPGTAITGYGLIQENEDGGLATVDFGVILTSADTPMPERLLELYHRLRELITSPPPPMWRGGEAFFSTQRAYCTGGRASTRHRAVGISRDWHSGSRIHSSWRSNKL